VVEKENVHLPLNIKMCIVLDYIRKYPSRIKPRLGINEEPYKSLIICAIAHHEELKKVKDNQKIRINCKYL
jgi:hypothetical protein